MEIQFIQAALNQKELLSNMLELYFYEQSVFDQDIDPLDLNDIGRYGFRKLDRYFSVNGTPWLLFADHHPAGFALIDKPSPENPNYEIGEFFILKKYRRLKLGFYMAGEVLKQYPDSLFIVNTSMQSKVAQTFWRKTACYYAESRQYREYPVCDGRRMEWQFKSASRK